MLTPNVMVICPAFVLSLAFSPPPLLAHKYGISSHTATGWVVTEEIDGEIQGIDYDCGITRTPPCTVESDGVYSPGQTIPYTNGNILIDHQAIVDLNPNQ
ncbi:hypothetical protein HB364_13615 [Pseudoflavitalea sp. X16]|uniref:hypothetical protein n=1 Tax=Paraflavitalea devenefica TaxID=2716334 RepID=UPI001420EBC6|nr:hypothetical protein [Paraflavitalea devenefica]NII26126.1 hypothetical protein [Paraflavitalea devenefica]